MNTISRYCDITAEKFGTTHKNIDLYIDAGSGTPNGSGAVGDPVDDIPAAYSKVPYEIDHLVHFHIVAGGSYTWPRDIHNVASPTGQLAFDASTVFDDVLAGPYTVTSWTPGGTGSYEYADVGVSGTPFTANALKDKYILGLTGTGAGHAVAIISNTTNSIRIAPFYNGLANGATFKIIEPGAKITLPENAGIRVANKTLPAFGETTTDRSHLCMIGLDFVNDISSGLWITDTSAWISHCTVQTALKSENCRLSGENQPPVDFAAAVDETNYRNATEPSSVAKSMYLSDTVLYQWLTDSVFVRAGSCKFISLAVENSGTVNGFVVHKSAYASINYSYIETPTKYGMEIYGRITMDNVYFEAATSAIYLKQAIAEVGPIGGNASNVTGHTFWVNLLSHIVLDTNPSFTGTAGAIYFKATAATDTIPAVDQSKTDSRGATIVRGG